MLERTGTSSLSDQRIYQTVQTKAAELVAKQAEIISQTSEKAENIKAVEVDIRLVAMKQLINIGLFEWAESRG